MGSPVLPTLTEIGTWVEVNERDVVGFLFGSKSCQASKSNTIASGYPTVCF